MVHHRSHSAVGARHTLSVSELAPGTTFAGCRIDAVVGRGGMGVIYRGTELRLGRPVALKLIAAERAADPEFRVRFEREARLTASIDHPNVIPVYAAGEEDGQLYLVMRYVDGTDLRHLLRDQGPLPPRRVDGLMGQLAAALDAAHAAGLVHRDVKPANVLLVAGARGEHAYLSDFGVVQSMDAETRITESGEFVGTADFMAPEHLRGEPTDARSDVYALGCVLVTALTGQPPFRRDTVPATIAGHLHDPPPQVSTTPGVPGALDAVVARALAKRPEARFGTAGDFARAVHAAVAGPALPAGTGGTVRGDEAEPVTRIVDQPTRVVDPATQIVAPVTAAGAAAASAPTHVAQPRPQAPSSARPRRRRPLTVLALLLVLGVGAGGTVLALGRGEETVRTDPGPMNENDVRGAAERFAAAYSAEDIRALASALTTDVKRVTPGEEQIGRTAVVAEYRRQFAGSDVRGYRFEDLQATGGRAGRVTGRYVVTRAGAPEIAGDIVLGVRRDRGRARIALIAAEPRA